MDIVQSISIPLPTFFDLKSGYLTVSGAAEFFMNVAQSIAGGYRGGPAKIAVIASGLLGMITGASVANVATTGSVTIPIMKRMGFQPHYAGAVEALASSGSQAGGFFQPYTHYFVLNVYPMNRL